MNKTVLGKTNYKAFSESKKNASLADKLRKYFAENNAIFVSGMQALNGNTNAFKTYLMLKK